MITIYHYLATHDMAVAALIALCGVLAANAVAVLKIADDRAGRRETRARDAAAATQTEEDKRRAVAEAERTAVQEASQGLLTMTGAEMARAQEMRDRAEARAEALGAQLATSEEGLRAARAELDRRDGKWHYWGLEPDDGFALFEQLLKERRERAHGD